MKIGFVGLGQMGFPMVKNLLAAKHDVAIYDTNSVAIEKAAGMGATSVVSLKMLVSAVDVVITMLPTPPIVRDVYTSPEGILRNVKKNTLLIDCSTGDPQTAIDLAKIAAAQGNPMIDAPVSGGVPGAEAGTLTFMVGGNEKDFTSAKAVLFGMGKNIVHCGPHGTGQVAKLCNNVLLGISMVGVSESMCLGVQLGMDPKVLAGIINTSSGRCWVSDTYNPYPGVLEHAPASKGFSGGFACDLMIKDLSLAIAAADGAKQPMPMSAVSKQLFQMLSLQGNGEKDISAMVTFFKSAN